MILSEILKGIRPVNVSGDTGIDITGISYDSRKVRPGHLFVAMRGEKADGHAYIANAVGEGAAAVAYEEFPPFCPGREGARPAVLVKVEDSRSALACSADNFFGNPSGSLVVAGITGTNGKTTTSYLLKSVIEAWGKRAGLIGTIQYMIGDEVRPATHTTPESLDFQELLATMRSRGCTHVVTEVSSHALAQKRVDYTRFAAAVYTNLTRDHLDYHRTMDEYYLAKRRLFADLLSADGAPVINLDDSYGVRLTAELRGAGKNVLTYGLEAGADFRATEIQTSFDGLKFKVVSGGKTYDFSSPLVGLPNVYNILAAFCTATALGVPWEAIREGIRESGTIRGRFEKVDAGQAFLAVVDYAHTEDALERLIYTAKGLTTGRVITVFGCGGERDRGKRPRMGAVATRLSDLVIITSDNPRSEDPEEIIKEIEAGAARKNYMVEPDRQEAIRRAVMITGENDVLLIAGKGHENYQEMNGSRIAFNDREVLEESIKRLIANR